jgi:GAF domain-containing protein
MCVPLASRNRKLGAISLAQATSGRWFGPVDLAVVEDLARRTAGAIERARRYQEARNANEAKDRLVSLLGKKLEHSVATLDAAAALLRAPVGGEEERRQAIGDVEECSRQLARLLAELAVTAATDTDEAHGSLISGQVSG